jgi:hypothetical protein
VPPVRVAETSSRATAGDLFFACRRFGLPLADFHFRAMRAVVAIKFFPVVICTNHDAIRRCRTFLTLYARKHTLLVFIDITIQSWYVYKQHNTRRIHTVVLLQTTVTATTKHARPSSRWRRRAPAAGPYFDVEETPSHKALTSRDSHHPRKTGSSPIKNMDRRNPPSLFNARSEASATPLFKRPDPPPSSANTQQSRPPHSKNIPSPCRHATTHRQIEATPTAWTPQLHKPLVGASNTSGEQGHRLGDHYS